MGPRDTVTTKQSRENEEEGEEGLAFDGAQGLASNPDACRALGNSGASSMSCAGQILSSSRHSRWSMAARKQHTACPNMPTLRYALCRTKGLVFQVGGEGGGGVGRRGHCLGTCQRRLLP